MSTPLRVLIVEDSEDDAILIMRELWRSGYDATFERVDTHESMTAVLAEQTWDIIIADYSMPHFSGLAALTLLKESRLNLPFILVSGTIGEDLAVAAMRAGAHDYVMKDNLARLGPAVQRELDEAEVRLARKRAEEALRESEEKLRKILGSSPDAITVTDLNGNIIECNQATLDIHGFSAKEELLGKSAMDFIAPKDQQRAAENMEKTLKQGSVKNLEYTFLTKDGHEFPAELSASVIRDSSGKPTSFVAITKDITERKRAEEQIKASLKEKEVLLKEIHHRVKNNLQIISSLLHLQSRYIKDKQDLKAFKDSQNRVRSMALVHEKLYQSQDLARIDLAEYIRNLTTDLFRSYGVKSATIKLKINVGEVLLGIDTAIPCGLIINELVSNSLKHAFPAGREGEICIDLHSDNDDKFVLIVRDNGVGFPKDLDFRNTESFGLRLVRTLTDQLEGNIELDSNGGTTFKITFPELKYREGR